MPHGARTPADGEELRRAIEGVVAGLAPDQVILFGSAARGDLTERSDLDLLVIKEADGADEERRSPLSLTDVARDVDILVSTRTAAEAARDYAGDVRGDAVETGITVYTREGFDAIRTGPTYLDDRKVVRRTLFRPDHAPEFLDRAERKWRIANSPQLHPADRCENLQAAMEQALKGLSVAQGRRIVHRHDLNAIWDDAEEDGEQIAATRNKTDLDNLTRYAGIYQYWNPRPGMPEKTWNATKDTGKDVLEHARKRIPVLVRETHDRLKGAGTPGTPNPKS